MSQEFKIVKREEWKANQPKYPYINIFPERIVVHHHEFEFKQRAKTSQYFKGPETILYLQTKDIKEGLNDIKYHFIIAPDGTVYEGRPIGTAGCHCKSYDNTTIAVMFFGNFNVEQLNTNQVRSFMLLMKHIKCMYKHMNIPKCIKNHRDYELTLCPGHHLANLINIIKTRTWNI